jgi:hypothetical protein
MNLSMVDAQGALVLEELLCARRWRELQRRRERSDSDSPGYGQPSALDSLPVFHVVSRVVRGTFYVERSPGETGS